MFAFGRKILAVPIHDDDETEDIMRAMPQILDIIDRHHQRGETVMVHCWEGISRSPCVVLAYLCIRCDIEMDEALSILTTANSKVDIYPLYLNQVRSALAAMKGRAKNRSIRE